MAISFYDYLVGVSKDEVLSEKKVYNWRWHDSDATGTVIDFVESMGEQFTYSFICVVCGKLTSKSGRALLSSQSLSCARGCSLKVTLARKRAQHKTVNIVTQCPEILEYWDYEKNTLDSESVTPGSHMLYWFKCKKGHSFRKEPPSMIDGMRYNSKGCPFCAKPPASEQNLESEFPDVTLYWDYEKNGFNPSEVTKGQSIPCWFKCRKGHSYKATPLKFSSALRKGSSSLRCPYCGNKKILVGFNDFESRYPDKAKYWDYEKNSKKPSEVTCQTYDKYWFRCELGHSYQIPPSSIITSKKQGCPYCGGLRVLKGFNDVTSNPDVFTHWNHDLNEVLPDEVNINSETKYWFTCPNGHNFESSPYLMKEFHKSKYCGCPYCKGDRVIEGENDLYTLRPDIMKYWDWNRSEIDPGSVSVYSNQEAYFFCKKCGKPYKTTVMNRSLTVGHCPDCTVFAQGRSEKESEVSQFIESLGFSVENNKHLSHGFEADIFVPELNTVIEFNGVFWHSEAAGKDKNSHKRKLNVCKKLGYRLLVVWEDWYDENPEKVRTWLKVKLGKSDLQPVNARDCNVSAIPECDAIPFFVENHLQGHAPMSKYIGLMYQGSCVALMAYSEKNGEAIIRRYASSCNVRGGFTKLLKALERSGVSSVVTFSDNAISDGQLYANSGFSIVSELEPDYSYLVNGRREHKFNYRIARFRDDPELLYIEGMSESELAVLNKMPRVWDYGKIKWALYFDKK